MYYIDICCLCQLEYIVARHNSRSDISECDLMNKIFIKFGVHSVHLVDMKSLQTELINTEIKTLQGTRQIKDGWLTDGFACLFFTFFVVLF